MVMFLGLVHCVVLLLHVFYFQFLELIGYE